MPWIGKITKKAPACTYKVVPAQMDVPMMQAGVNSANACVKCYKLGSVTFKQAYIALYMLFFKAQLKISELGLSWLLVSWSEKNNSSRGILRKGLGSRSSGDLPSLAVVTPRKTKPIAADALPGLGLSETAGENVQPVAQSRRSPMQI